MWELRRVLAASLIGVAGLGSLGGCGESGSPKVAGTAGSMSSPVASPDGKKVIRLAFPVAESGFDPHTVPDLYSAIVVDSIFDTVLTYDYLSEPAKLVPKITTEMPTVEDGGKLYTIKLQKGIFFAPHEAFGGKKRELTATDVAYTFKRHFDDSIKPVWRFLVSDKIVGLNEWYAAGKLRPHVSQTFPLHKAADALKLMAARQVKGKVVLTT